FIECGIRVRNAFGLRNDKSLGVGYIASGLCGQHCSSIVVLPCAPLRLSQLPVMLVSQSYPLGSELYLCVGHDFLVSSGFHLGGWPTFLSLIELTISIS